MSLAADRPTPSGPRWVRDLGLGLLYWLAFLLLLEPGNIVHALDAGQVLAWDREAVRIGAAALMGTSATPLLLWLVERFPVGGRDAWPRLAIHAAAGAGVSAALIVIANRLSAWLLTADSRPLALGLRQDLAADWALLAYAIGLFIAIAHAVRHLRAAAPPAAPASPDWLTRVTVAARGRQTLLALAEVDWIETHGNYLALHAGGATHLIRETSRRFEARLDPARFVRIHRRIIVATDRIEGLTLLEAGDAELRLRDGQVLRVSRSHRREVQARLKGA